MKWNVPVSFDELPAVEEKLQGSILVLNLYELPVLGTCNNIYDSIMYKSDCIRGDKQFWLLYDSHSSHYHAINNIKGFMGVREFCHRCMQCFNSSSKTDKANLEKHTCTATEQGLTQRPEKAKPKRKENAKILKDSAHYMRKDVLKGSEEDLEKNPKKSDKILSPRYIILRHRDRHVHSNPPPKSHLCQGAEDKA